MLLQPTRPADSILGYTLRDKIGAGGYGEVWVADAPGGLTKAVKIIYGYHDESRAQRELKALNRIKQVRHPFLLSLERIDIVEGRLVVVTELAEQSLKDRYRQAAVDGEIGIPRDELLGYLTDAAEALDYIYDSYSLLHLDVKPENLLLVGGHVKLADFGLVKEIQDVSLSVMGGLTPTYAAPEVFEGQPVQASDQYSLAIVFQEMLTGKRPFSGATPAKLALQHLHETPDLNGLSPGDQAPLRRALAKSPAARFPSCRAFLDELSHCRSRPRRRKGSQRQSVKANEMTPADTFAKTLATPMRGISSVAKKAGEVKLPPLQVPDTEATFRPTLFVGIGQTATAVLRKLKRRLQERLGDTEQRPALRMLCLDTDTRDLNDALTATDGGRLDQEEVLALPLKSPAEYRDDAEAHFSWLSRRWIYNIPRSRQTEGLRPLGRLAFVDHHDKVFDRLHRVIGEMTDADAVAKTAQLCEMPLVDNNPRVFVVASISGGTGSGMVADVAYTVRMVLAERGLKDFPVHGILLYTNGRSSTHRDITVANAYCCLSELFHYSHGEGYPGDPSCDLPVFDDGPTFEDTYLIDIGYDPLADEYAATADVLSEYLFLDAATSFGDYLGKCREDNLLIDEGMYLRTLGVSHSGGMDGDAVSLSTKFLCGQMLRNWLCSADEAAQKEDSQESFPRAFAELGLSVDLLISRLQKELRDRLGRDPLDLVQAELEPLVARLNGESGSTPGTHWLQEAEDTVDRVLGIGANRRNKPYEACIKSLAEQLTDEIADNLGSKIVERVYAELDRAGRRVGQAELFHRQLGVRVEQLTEGIVSRHREMRSQLARVVQSISGRQPSGGEEASEHSSASFDLAESICDYGTLRLNEFMSAYLNRLSARIAERLQQVSHELSRIRQDLSQLFESFQTQSALERDRHGLRGMTAPQTVVSSMYLKSTAEDVQELVAQLDKTIQRNYLSAQGGLRQHHFDANDPSAPQLAQAVYRHARALIAARIQVMDFDSLLNRHGVSDEQVGEWVKDSLKLAIPNLVSSCGGQSRLIVAVPRGSQGNRLKCALESNDANHAKILSVTDGDIAFCQDVGGIPVHQVAALLLESCPRSADIISRVHTRTDIKWTPLIQLD